MHDRPGQVFRQRRHAGVQPGEQLINGREVSGLGQLPLLGPACNLAAEESTGPAQLSQSDLGRIDGVQIGEDVDQFGRQGAGILDGEIGGRGIAADDASFDVLHDQEASADDGVVIAVGQGPRCREATPCDTADHLEFPTHVMRRGHDMAEWWSAYDDLLLPLTHQEGHVGQATGQSDRLDVARGVDEIAGTEPGHEEVEVQTFRGSHGRTLSGWGLAADQRVVRMTLPVVRRARMSSWARRACANG